MQSLESGLFQLQSGERRTSADFVNPDFKSAGKAGFPVRLSSSNMLNFISNCATVNTPPKLMEVIVKMRIGTRTSYLTMIWHTAAWYARINIKCDENASERLFKIGGFANLLIFITVLSHLLETYWNTMRKKRDIVKGESSLGFPITCFVLFLSIISQNKHNINTIQFNEGSIFVFFRSFDLNISLNRKGTLPTSV